MKQKFMTIVAAVAFGLCYVLLPAIGFAQQSADGYVYERWLRIHNETSSDLCYIRISHVDRRYWGPDLLRGRGCISPGYYMQVDPGWQQGYCVVDMKFEFEDGDEVVEVVRSDYNICEGTDFTIHD